MLTHGLAEQRCDACCDPAWQNPSPHDFHCSYVLPAAFTRQRQEEAAAKEVGGGNGEGGMAFGAAQPKKRRI